MERNVLRIAKCDFELDFDRGVIYIHSSEGYTILRICGCPVRKKIPEQDTYDITLKQQVLAKHTFNW